MVESGGFAGRWHCSVLPLQPACACVRACACGRSPPEGWVTLRVLLKTCGCVFESRTHGFCGYAALFSSCQRHCVQLLSSRVARIPLPVAASRDPGPSFSLAGQGWGSGCMLCWLYLPLTFSCCGCMCLRLHLGAGCPYHVVQCSCRTCGSITQHAGCALFDCW